MWYNMTIPVPTYGGERAGSHTHSSRRKSWSRNIKNQRLPAPATTSGGLHSNPAVHVPYYGQSNTGSGTVFPYLDSFSEPEAYFDWISSGTRGITGKSVDERAYRPASLFRPRVQTNSDTSMPDYVPSCGPELDPAQVPEPGMGGDVVSLMALKNTPVTGVGQSFQSTQGTEFQLLSDPTTLSPDFASSLAQSLLNQPFPLPVPHCDFSFPSPEPKSRKEIRHATFTRDNSALTQLTPCVDGTESRKLSQPLFGSDSADLAAPVSSSEGPENQEKGPLTPQAVFSASSCSNSSGDYGSNITDVIYGSTELSSEAAAAYNTNESPSIGPFDGVALLGNTSNDSNVDTTCTGVCRTPASVKTTDEEDRPLRVTPH